MQTPRPHTSRTALCHAIATEALHFLNYGFLPEIETDPIRAALWSAAAACIQHTTGEWWCSSVVACGETFSVIESYLYGDEAAEDMDPDTAAFLLLLIREADATSRDLLH